MESVFNYNIGVLGHIDSGKTSVVRALSTVLSTASLDKSPQSQERKITLDLGFSACQLPMPARLGGDQWLHLQLTLVDCPGHAGLIRTVLAGSSIIDKMMLIIDATKGIQTQTAECIVIGELLVKGSLVVVLNKIDLVEPAKLAALETKVRTMLSRTRFGTNLFVVKTAAAPRNGPPAGIDDLLHTIVEAIEFLPERNSSGPLCYLVDHCFPIKGKGTVMTGTLVCGTLKVGDKVEIVNLRETKKVKSMQSFHKEVAQVHEGDRVAVCVTQFNSKQLERGIVSVPGAMRLVSSVILRVQRIPYFKGRIPSKGKLHFVLANEVVMGQCTFFSAPTEESKDPFEQATDRFVPELFYAYEPALETQPGRQFFAVAQLESPLCIIDRGLILGARLDMDVDGKQCRLAFHGETEYIEPPLSPEFVRIYKDKGKTGRVERVKDEYTAVGTDMFSKNSDFSKFLGLKVTVEDTTAVIDSSFGKSGKFNLYFPEGDAKLGSISLQFKKLLWDSSNRLVQ